MSALSLELLQALSDRHPDLAAHLQVAVELMGKPGGIHLKMAAHALRELGFLLPKALGIETRRRGEELEDSVRKLATRWPELPPVTGDSEVRESEDDAAATMGQRSITLPADLVRATRDVLNSVNDEEQFPQVAQLVLRALDPLAHRAYYETIEPGVRHWARLHRWFVAKCHARDLEALERDREGFLSQYHLYEQSLRAMFAPAVDTIAELETLVLEAPTDTNVARALALLKKAAARHRFFSSLDSPEWLGPLRSAGLFKDPYKPVPAGQLISFPEWPPAKYLTRIAARTPSEVAEVIRGLALTENHTVRAEFVEAALAMPAANAAGLVSVFRNWLKMPQYVRVPLLLGHLGAKLAKEGQTRAAVKLLGGLLSFDPPSGDQKYFLNVRPRLDRFEYEMVLKEVAGALLEAAGQDLLDLLCRCLNAAVRQESGIDANDRSWIWMRDLGTEVEYSNGAKEALAAAVMRTSRALVGQSAERAQDTIVRLRRERYLIFRRVELRALAEAVDGVPASRERLLDKQVFGSAALRLDYDLLLPKRWCELEEADRETILAWIKEGPDLAWLVDDETKRNGPEQAEKARQSYLQSWQLARLGPITEFLEGEAASWFKALKEGREPLPAPFSTEAVWVGLTSPLSTEEMANRSPLEVVSFLRTWQPEEGLREPSRGGLARLLTSVVAAKPLEWSGAGREFSRGIDSTYVRCFLFGLETSAQENRPLDWGAILDLCLWAVAQPRELAQPRGRDEDPDWGWTRRAIASLLQRGLQRGPGLPFEERGRVWEILETLGADPSPDAEEEGPFGEEDPRDPATVAINSVRGEALHAVVEYALWCARNLQAKGEHAEPWMKAVPEVHDYLDRVLDRGREPSIAVRSVLVHYLPNLAFLDRAWLERALENIFTPFDRMWETYLLYAQLHGTVVPLLMPLYLKACRRPARARRGAAMNDPDRHLAEHVLLLAGYFGDRDTRTGEVVEAFFSHASGAQRAHIIGFSGWYVEGTGDLPVAVLECIKQLVENRVHAAMRAGDAEELSEFAVLFNAAAFPDEWLVKLARVAVPITPSQSFEYKMPERIGSIADADLPGAMDVFELVSRKDIQPMDVHLWSEPGEKILRLALRAGGVLKVQARITINNFIEQGYNQFEHLLKIVDDGELTD